MFWRLKCHACGSRSKHSKGEVEQFRCDQCEAWTFVDKDGGYLDPPAQHTSRTPQSHATSTSQQSIFCSQCLRNQQIYNDLLSDYLPDEEDRRYDQYLARLPAYKEELEQKYPQICKACAPRAQSIIHEADYYSMTNNVSRAMRRSTSPVALRRDTKEKFVVRLGLRLVGLLVSASALFQVLWHVYAVVQLRQGVFESGTAKASECVEALSRMSFTYPCVVNGASKVPMALALSVCLLWYNPGLIQLYDPHVRIASVAGAGQHLLVSSMVLAVRAFAWVKLTGADLTVQQMVAAHLGTALVIVAGHFVARRTIETEKWRVQGSIMPRPEDRDVLGQHAGPAQEKRTPKVSSIGPIELLREQFPIQRLAPKITLPPSPVSEGDPMDIEAVPPAQQPSIPVATWNGVRTNLFGIEGELRAKQQRATGDTPFRGRLPAAPMSQERRLRNPMSQVQFRRSPAQKQDFVQQMRDGIERGRGYRRPSDSESEISTAAARTRGQLDLAASSWDLPDDGGSILGIEDSFSGARLEDKVPLVVVEERQNQYGVPVLAAAMAVIIAFVLDLGGIRRTSCMYLVGVLEDIGY